MYFIEILCDKSEQAGCGKNTINGFYFLLPINIINKLLN